LVREGGFKSLGVRINGNELNTLQTGRYHAIYSITPAASNTHDLDLCGLVLHLFHLKYLHTPPSLKIYDYL
jgi:hypothetical protein